MGKASSVLATYRGEEISSYLIISFTINTMPPKKKNESSYTQLETPKKNKIIGAAQFCEENGYKYTKASLASTF